MARQARGAIQSSKLVDMALDPVDHTYASHKGFLVPFQKKGDHNYSITRKNVKKNRSTCIQTGGDKEEKSGRWRSEENLSLDINAFDELAVSVNSRKKCRSTEFECAHHDDTNDTCNSVVLCSSWPKENRLCSSICTSNEIRMDGTDSTDHTYAKETLKQQCSVRVSSHRARISEISNFELLAKLSITADHTYTDKHGECAFATKSQHKPLIRFDHSYVNKNSIPCFGEQGCKTRSKKLELKSTRPPISGSSKDHNYLGSCESLDMQLSASDTDSCDEPNENITELAFTAWCQLRRDHPYSSF